MNSKNIKTFFRRNSLNSFGIGILICSFTLLSCTKKEETPLPNSDKQDTKEPMAAAQGDGVKSKGIGPVTELKMESVSVETANKGKILFEAKCSACHKIGERYVGPDLKGSTQRRTPEWIMNMILNPVEMTQKDPQAQELLGEYLTQMTFQNVTQEEARQILEYFRQVDGIK